MARSTCCAEVAVLMLRSADDRAVMVVVSEVPCGTRRDGLTASPACRVPGLDLDCGEAAEPVVGGVVPARLPSAACLVARPRVHLAPAGAGGYGRRASGVEAGVHGSCHVVRRLLWSGPDRSRRCLSSRAGQGCAVAAPVLWARWWPRRRGRGAGVARPGAGSRPPGVVGTDGREVVGHEKTPGLGRRGGVLGLEVHRVKHYGPQAFRASTARSPACRPLAAPLSRGSSQPPSARPRRSSCA